MAPPTSNDTIFSSCLFYFSCFITAVVVHLFIKKRKPIDDGPPSPPGLPLIGHLHLMGSVPVQSFQALARRYGPLLKIRLGGSTFVVASTASVAKEILKTHDLSFSSRPEFGSSEFFIYKGSRFLMAPYGDYWRFMKKLCMTRLLSVPQLEKFVSVREEEKTKLVEKVMDCCKEGNPFDFRSELTALTNNIFCRMAMSTRCSTNGQEAEEIKELVHTCLTLAAKLVQGDVLGPLRVFDFSGTGKKLAGALNKYDQLVERIIKEHEEKFKSGFQEERKDLVDILLETSEDPMAEIRLSKKDMKSFLLVSHQFLLLLCDPIVEFWGEYGLGLVRFEG